MPHRTGNAIGERQQLFSCLDAAWAGILAQAFHEIADHIGADTVCQQHPASLLPQTIGGILLHRTGRIALSQAGSVRVRWGRSFRIECTAFEFLQLLHAVGRRSQRLFVGQIIGEARKCI